MSTKAAAATPIEKKTRTRRTKAEIEASRVPPVAPEVALGQSIDKKRADIANLKANLALAEKDLDETLATVRGIISLEVK